MALLEALVAITILTIGGLAAATAVRQGVESARRAQASEAEVDRVNAFLEAIALWPREDLDRHLGDRADGDWRLAIDRPVPTLYRVTLSDSAGQRVLVETALYRPLPAGTP